MLETLGSLVVVCRVFGLTADAMQVWHGIDTNATGQEIILLPNSISGFES